jgi:uncharacterized protein YkwD
VKLRGLSPVLLATLALAGCGGTGDDRAPSASLDGTRNAAPASPVQAGVTAGRTGSATSATNLSQLAEIDPGGRIDPRATQQSSQRREGVGAGASCENVDLAPADANLDVIAAATLCLLNGERADRGLAPVTTNTKLASAAMSHTRDMVANSYFSHDAPNGSDVVDRVRATGYFDGADGWTVGENLAWGTGALATPRSIMQAWMDSTGHRENILRREFREIGFGVVTGNPRAADGQGATYTTAFGAANGVDPASNGGGGGSTAQPSPNTGTTGSNATDSATVPAIGRESGVNSATTTKARSLRACRSKQSRKARAAKTRAAKAKYRKAAKRCRGKASRKSSRRR